MISLPAERAIVSSTASSSARQVRGFSPITHMLSSTSPSGPRTGQPPTRRSSSGRPTGDPGALVDRRVLDRAALTRQADEELA
ncbi:hypothetical protein [Streptomyces sp. 2231.1]|uniref:hypothetical protein n=1 Tax=Streptomyces sp. 2231.1 TaxID=1855347 RepID=UPI00115FA8E3|nr:hypothetical protein [Streptomyces sp. 2231.1]